MFRCGLLVIAILILAPIGRAVAGPVCPEPLKIGYNDFSPYQIILDSGDIAGMDVEILQLIAAKLDCRLEFVMRPWKRQLMELEHGSIDIVMTALYSEERAAYAQFSIPYGIGSNSLITRIDHPNEDTSLEEFLMGNHTLGISRGYLYGAEQRLLEDSRFRNQIRIADDPIQNTRLLEAGRIDGIIGDMAENLTAAAAAGVRSKLKVISVYSRTPQHFMLSRATTTRKLLTAFNKAIKELLDDGSISGIVDSYSL